MKYTFTLVYAFLLFLFLILIHELGHFISAKILGVTVKEFSIGMGPALWKKEKKGTLYALRLIPLGGYCRLEGEEVDETTDKNDPHSFLNQPYHYKFLILAAGSFMNIFLCLLIIFILYLCLDASILKALVLAFYLTGYFIKSVFDSIAMLFSGMVSSDEVMGIVGIASVVSQQAKTGLADVTYLMAILSANLGVMNLLPIPALDGGRILLLIIRWISRGRLSDKTEAIIHAVGMVLLMALMIFLIVKDTIKLI